MKLVAWIFGGLVGLWALLLLVGLVLPGHYRVERSTVVAARPAAVFPLVGDLKAWRQWGVWFGRDPAMQPNYSPATTEVGAWSQWKSKSQGDGKMTITAVRPPDYFEYRMEFADMGMASKGTVELAGARTGRPASPWPWRETSGTAPSTAGSGSSWAGSWPRTSTRGWRT